MASAALFLGMLGAVIVALYYERSADSGSGNWVAARATILRSTEHQPKAITYVVVDLSYLANDQQWSTTTPLVPKQVWLQVKGTLEVGSEIEIYHAPDDPTRATWLPGGDKTLWRHRRLFYTKLAAPLAGILGVLLVLHFKKKRASVQETPGQRDRKE